MMNNQWRDNSNQMVVWADGSYDKTRVCDVCDRHDCPAPVHTDHYKEVGTTRLEEELKGLDDSEEPAMGYWDWMHTVQPLGAKRDHDGDLVTPELSFANPDNLPEVGTRSSTTDPQWHQWMQEAYELLSDEQKEAWDAVNREQVSEMDLARQLGITKQAINFRLAGATRVIKEYFKSKGGDVDAAE